MAFILQLLKPSLFSKQVEASANYLGLDLNPKLPLKYNDFSSKNVSLILVSKAGPIITVLQTSETASWHLPDHTKYWLSELLRLIVFFYLPQEL